MINQLLEKLLKSQNEESLCEGVSKARELYVDTNKISNSSFDRLVDIDPTPQKKYIEWMVKVFVRDNMHHVDIGKFEVIKDFYTLCEKGIIKNKNINAYENIEKVYDEVKKHEDVKTASDIEREHKKGADVIFENDKVLIIRPKTREASCYYGKGTKWCTAGDVYNYFNSYHYEKSVNLYYAIAKKTQDKMAIAVYPSGKKEYYDSKDNVVSSLKAKKWLSELGVPITEGVV